MKMQRNKKTLLLRVSVFNKKDYRRDISLPASMRRKMKRRKVKPHSDEPP